MAILNYCVKLCNLSFTRTFGKHISPQLFNTTIKPSHKVREISDYAQKSLSPKSDVNQALVCFKLLRLIKKSIRENGPFVEENKKLEDLLARANKHGLSPDSIDFVQRVAVDSRANLGFLELFLSNNCHFIIQYEDLDLSRTKPYINKLCERNDAFMGEGNVKWPLTFEQKGIICVRSHDSTFPFKSVVEAQAAALKLGAQTVKQEVDPEGISYLQFTCESGDVQKVKRQLDQEGCEIEEAYVGYIAKNKIALSGSSRKAACEVINELSTIPTIDNVYINIL